MSSFGEAELLFDGDRSVGKQRDDGDGALVPDQFARRDPSVREFHVIDLKIEDGAREEPTAVDFGFDKLVRGGPDQGFFRVRFCVFHRDLP